MRTRHRTVLLALGIIAALVVVLTVVLQGHNIAVLNPKGIIALKQRNLMITATLLTLVVVIPVFIMTFFIAWKYREGNTAAKYSPDWDHNRIAETTWWTVPLIIILILAGITWVTSHELDPYQPLASNKPPLTIQVVALPWKWLFIYPKQNIATVNYLQIPNNTPINFQLTSDAPMNSFWIPQLGGQVYAMAGMSTNLHLMSTQTGAYYGSSANLSGRGFAGMRFITTATSQADFDNWVRSAKQSPNRLTNVTYDNLAKPSENTPVTTYAATEPGLYDSIIMKYMLPSSLDQLNTNGRGLQ